MSVELINKVGVDCQIADEGMIVGEAEELLLGLLAQQTSKIFKTVGAGFERFGTGGIYRGGRVLFDEAA